MVALDLRAAFDTIWHNGLLYEMFRLGVNCFLIRIVQSMLAGRTFSVRLGGLSTIPYDMVAGVPQGSVLGPLCFDYYVADIPSDNVCKNLQFADDATTYCTYDNPGHAQNALNKHLVRLSGYFANSKLLLNEGKTEMLHIMGFARDTSRTLRRGARNIKISLKGKLL